MKINPYYIAGGVALLVILIVVFTQRSDWDANRFILSADSKGNLTPVSESYFEDQEKKIMEKVAEKMRSLDFEWVKPVSGPNVMWRGQHQGSASSGQFKEILMAGGNCGGIHAEGRYVCPAGSMPFTHGKSNGRCGCAVWKYG